MLDRVLQILILRLNSEKLIQDSLRWCPRSQGRIVDSDVFAHLFRHDNVGFTLDQIKNIEALLYTNWIKGKTESVDYKYSKRDSLFNVVLRFSENVLVLSNNQPVCKYDYVLNWHEMSMLLGEDLFTTALTASYDAQYARKRHKFMWKPYIMVKHPTLEQLFKKPLTDLHAHLKGTSLNFDLNWMSLMNQIQNREKMFEKLNIHQHVQVTVKADDYVMDLYHQIMKAAAIRLYLYSVVKGHGDDVKDCVMEMLATNSRIEATNCSFKLQECIDCYRQMYGKRYYLESTGYDVADYAISCGGWNDEKDLLVTVLSGERELLYSLLKLCYEGKLNYRYEQLLIAYIIIKTRFRQEVVQLNGEVGFGNFATYEERKTAFIKAGTVYERLLPKFAVGNFLSFMPGRRYMEVRIVPNENVEDMRRHIKKIDKNVHNSQFGKGDEWNYYYIFHFIKVPDNTSDLLKELVPRHHALREKVKRQAKTIFRYRNLNFVEGENRAVGIDAANSEIMARPEVFAQAFRYLRRHTIGDEVYYRPCDLGITYHVGEDFLDITDGLRAYDEVVRFLQYVDGDRLGHALVLGIDVETYYKRRHYVVAMPLQMILDNTVWLYEECKFIGDPYILTPQLEKDFERYFRMVYGGMPICSIHTYYRSWLLRGDNPFCYQVSSEKPELTTSVDEWELNNLVTGDYEIELARDDDTARYLYSRYHFDKNVKNNGSRVEEYQVTKAYVRTLEIIKECKLQDAERRHLAIECNPTSNYKIGELMDFSEHPISKFYNKGLVDNKKSHCLSVTINTDDAGLFATSIEREYAVLAKAMEDKYCHNNDMSPKQVYDWLDDVRRFGQQQKFVKDEKK